MAVEDRIPVAGVGYTRLDIGWEEGSKELKNRHRSVEGFTLQPYNPMGLDLELLTGP